jgi:hypothetical protein
VYGVYAGFAACLLAVNLYYSQVTYRSLRDGVMLRFENLALIGELQHERDRATAADQAKTRFLAAAGHDLRQPVYAIGLQAAALAALGERGEVAGAQAQAIGRRLQGTLARIDGLLDGLLDVSRLDAGLMPVHRRPLSLAHLMAELRDEYAEQAWQRGCVLRVVPARAWIDSDPDLLKRILDNLLANALRHAPGTAWKSRSSIPVPASMRPSSNACSMNTCRSPATRPPQTSRRAPKDWAWAWRSCGGWPDCWGTRSACSRCQGGAVPFLYGSRMPWCRRSTLCHGYHRSQTCPARFP